MPTNDIAKRLGVASATVNRAAKPLVEARSLVRRADGRFCKLGDDVFALPLRPADRRVMTAISLWRGRWSPGAPVPVSAIARDFGKSRTTVGLDLGLLGATGLVVDGPHRWRVAGGPDGGSGPDRSPSPAERVARAASNLPSTVEEPFRTVCGFARVFGCRSEGELGNVWRIWRELVDDALPPFLELDIDTREALVDAIGQPVPQAHGHESTHAADDAPPSSPWLAEW